MATQNNWRWCNKCQGLFFVGSTFGVCPAGGTHSPPGSSGSADYDLTHTTAPAGYQPGWRWCHKCNGMFFSLNTTSGHCPTGGGHSFTGSGTYFIKTAPPVGSEQNNWRWCNRCQGLFYAAARTSGHCPATGGHNFGGSGNYSLAF